MAEVTLAQCDQWRERIVRRWPNIPQGWADAFSEFMTLAIAEEREQCALTADDLARGFDDTAREEFSVNPEAASAYSAASGACLAVRDAIRNSTRKEQENV